jgi:integrase
LEIRWTENGKTRTKSTGTTDHTTAEGILRHHVIQWHQPQLPPEPTIDNLIAGYRQARKLTAKSSQSHALTKISERLGSHHPREITDDLLSNYADWRKAQQRWGRSGTIGDGTVAREVNALRAVLGWAYRNQHIARAAQIRLPVPHPESRQRFLTRDEVDQLLEAAKPTPHLGLFIRIALATAARRSAILELTWERVIWPSTEDPLVWRFSPGNEIEYQALRLGLALDMGRGVGNKRRAIVPIGDNASLYRALRRAEKIARTPYVIEFRGKRIEDIKTAFLKACRKGGLAGVTPHTLKHTSVSWMVQRGIPFGQITKITGTSAQTLDRHYSHLSRSLAEELGDMFAV